MHVFRPTKINNRILTIMKNVIITGASGLVATELGVLLSKRDDIQLYLISTHPNKLADRYGDKQNIKYFTLNEFKNYHYAAVNRSDILIHTAFSRSSEGDLLAQSIDYTSQVLQLVKEKNIRSFINISSQSIYGQKYEPLWKETTPAAPNYMYALGKYSTEVLTNTFLDGSNTNFTNIRLSSVCENARFLNVFVKNAIGGIPIKVFGGNQRCSFIDVRDVACALEAVIDMADKIELDNAYNLGTNQTYTIAELADSVKRVAKESYSINAQIEREDADIKLDVGMDSSRFMKTFNWEPTISVDDMIRSLFEFIINVNGGLSY